VAADIFYANGFTAGTTREIASRVGLTQPTLYHYVGKKEDLLREIALRVDAEMSDALERGLASSDQPREQLTAVLTEFTEAVIRNQKLFAVYYKEQHLLAPEVRKQVAEHERAFVRRTAQVVRALQRDGTLPAGTSATVVTEAMIGMASWTYHWYRPEGRVGAREIARVFLQLLHLNPKRH
jgi:TetR/AcrR family transcriptional regulator, cholesterol catabolism regulator